MLIVLRANVSPSEQLEVEWFIASLGLLAHPVPGSMRTAIGITGNRGPIDPEPFLRMAAVAEVIPVTRRPRQVDRGPDRGDTAFSLGNVPVGDGSLVVAAGPPGPESPETLQEIARALGLAGVRVFRARGLLNPFPEGHRSGGEGPQADLLSLMEGMELPLLAEASHPASIDALRPAAAAFEVGARNMTHLGLLHALGEMDLPVLLRRGIGATLSDLLDAAEEVVTRGNGKVILVECGIRTFEPSSRRTFDVAAIPTLKRLSHLPVFADPSRPTGRHDLVGPLARAAVAAGADGILLDVHPEPIWSSTGSGRALDFAGLDSVMAGIRAVAGALDRTLA